MTNKLENTICCFEYWSNLSVTVHDLTGKLRMILPQERFAHCHHLCRKAKEFSEKLCRSVDIQILQNEVWAFNNCGYKICHAGLLEYVMPLNDGGKRIGIIFAGAVKPPADWENLHPLLMSDVPDRKLICDKNFDWERSRQIIGALRMLSITIMYDLKEFDKEKQRQVSPARKEVIHRFIGEFCDQKDLLEKLARKLYLSIPRTIHVVKEETGYRFQQLRKAYQMRLAAARLRFSNESISHVAAQCGFDDVSTLHRNFKKYFNVTPLAYRKQYDSDNEMPVDIQEIGDYPGRPH
jgi:AraC-like DNA-binding protein